MKKDGQLYFVIGSQKSGTTWLRDSLSNSIEFCKPEWYYPDLYHATHSWVSLYGAALGPDKAKRLSQSASRSAFLVALDGVAGEKSAYPCVSNHMPKNFERYRNAVNLMKDHFPEGQTIVIVRDPRAVFNSLRHFFDHHRLGWGAELDVDEFATEWATQNLAWKDSQPNALIRYEDLKTNFRESLGEILEKIGISYEQNDIDFAHERYFFIEKLRPMQPEIYRTGTIDEWKTKLPREIISRIDELAGDIMHEFGYEKADC